MIRRSIVLKLWLTIIVLVLVVLAILALYLEQFFDTYIQSIERRDLVSQTILVSELLEQEPNPVLAYDIGAQVVTALHSHLDILPPPAQDPPVARFLATLSPSEKRLLADNQPVIREGLPPFLAHPDPDTNMYALVPIVMPMGQITAYVVITESHDVAGDPVRTISMFISVAVIVGMLMATGLAFVILKNLSRPLLEMNEAAEQMAKGRFNLRVRVVTQDEVGRLGMTINHVAQELEQTVRALNQEKEEITGILGAMTDAVVAADTEGNLTLLNPAARSRLASTRRLARSSDAPVELPEELVRMQKDTLEARQTVEREFEWHNRVIVTTMTPLYDSDAPLQPRGTLAVLRDVTEERRLDRLRTDFVANVSHELRTPLAMMQGYAEALLDDFAQDSEQRQEFARIIHDESLRMRRLVNELLDLAQLESGHFAIRAEQLDLVGLARRVVRKFSVLANDRSLFLEVNSPSDSLTVVGDEDRLEQVLTNLVDNALRHTFDGGVTVDVLDQEEHVSLRVMDTGEGISAEDLPFVFERFYKADKARTRARGGTGLGLSIARSLIRRHGGEISAQSTRGVGTVFTIILPKDMPEDS